MFKRALWKRSFHDSAGDVNKGVPHVHMRGGSRAARRVLWAAYLFLEAILFLKRYFDSLWVLKYIYLYKHHINQIHI